MDIKTLCRRISLPEEVTERILSAVEPVDEAVLKRLCCPVHSPEAYEALARHFGDRDMAMLACQLRCACRVWKRYLDKGIPEEIFFDTMGCYRRFLGEAKRMYGDYRFDRAWWTWHQLSMRLFRIGQLEYEIMSDKRVISVHIPSDSDLSPEQVSLSLGKAKAFFREYYPQCANWPYVCQSWLLSPQLRKFLGPESNILRFQKRFLLLKWEREPKDYLQWLFAVPKDTPPEVVPEETSLQRKVKAHLLGGGKIGIALGVITKF